MKTILIVETAEGREKLFQTAEDTFATAEALVKITDTISLESSTLTVPLDDRAEVIAREAPKLLPGGVTALVSYVKVPAASLKATEYRMEQTEVVATREVTLRPERVGKRQPEELEPAA